MGGGQDTGHRSAVWYWSAERRTINIAIDILGAQGCMLEMCCVCVLSAVDIRGAGHRTSDSWDWTSNILNPQDPWGIENIVSYFTYFRAREKCTILIFICMEMGHLRSNVTPPPPVCSDLNICVQGAGCSPNCWCGHDGDWIWSRRLEMGTRARLSPPASVPETTHRRWSPWHRRLCNNFHHLYIQSWWDPAQSKIL